MNLFPAIASPPDAPRGTPVARRVQNVLAVALIALFVGGGWQGREPTGVGGADELEYRALSQSIEQGTYREIFRPDAPRAIKYPPVFPAWLTVLRATTGDHLDGVRLANILFTATALTIVFLIVRIVAGGWIAVGALAASALNPSLLEFSGSMLSEPLYILTSTASLGAAFLAQRGRAKMAGVAIAFALLAFLTRTAGITIVVAIGIWLLLSRRRSDLVVFAVASVVVLGAWFGYVATQDHSSAGAYGAELSDAAADDAKQPVASGLVMRVVNIGTTMATRTLVAGLGLPTIEGTIVDNVAWLGALLVLLPLGLLTLWPRWPAVVTYIAVYGGLILVWPYSNNRILAPTLLFLVPALLVGARRASQMLPGAANAGAMTIFSVLLLIGGLRTARTRYEHGRQCDRDNPLARGCYLPHAYAIVQAGEFVRTHAQPGDIAVSSKSTSMYFLSGLQTVPSRLVLQAPRGKAVDDLRARNARFVVLGLLFRGEDGSLAESIMPQCRETKVEYNNLPNMLILSLRPPGETSEEACTAIPEFLKGFPPNG